MSELDARAQGVDGAHQPLVTISVVNWGTCEQTLACIESLRALTYPACRVVVVDNASPDNSAQRIRAACPDITVLSSPSNAGFAGGHTLALAQARQWQSDAIWLINPDARPEADALDYLVSAWRAQGDAIYGGAPLRTRNDGRQCFDFPSKFLDPDGDPSTWKRDREIVYDTEWAQHRPMRAGAVSGTTLLLPLRIVDRHGWLRPEWFMYCEEIDYCYRLRSEGVACWLVPQARIRHQSGGSVRGRQRVADVMEYYHARNEIALARLHASTATTVRFALKKIARGLLTLPVNTLRARCILRGAWHGILGIDGKQMAPEDFL